MKTYLKFTTTVLTLFNATLFFAAEPEMLVNDDYSQQKYPKRNAARGDWKIADGVASVEQDDELYKKYKNHGPIMIYKVAHTNAHAVIEFKPTDCKTVVFTMDAAAGGHAFRVKLRTETGTKAEPPSQIVTYLPKEEGASKAKPVLLNGKDVPKLKNNDWNHIEITVVGEDATVTIGGKTISVSHPQIAQKKGIAKLGFSFGGLAIRNFSLETR